MREDLISSHWPQLRGVFRERWPMLTDADLAIDHGDISSLIRMLRQRYAFDCFEAWRQIHEFKPDLWYIEKDSGEIEAVSF